jgi:ribosomal protein S18 acetylase RimI-like enzyme
MKIEYQQNPNNIDIEIITNGLIRFAKEKKKLEPIESFAFFIRNKNKIVGGCNGALFYGSCHIDQLWIAKEYRKQGFGRQIICEIEKLARSKKCLLITVNTMDWEALDFYKHFGFIVDFERKGYAHNSTLYFLKKII